MTALLLAPPIEEAFFRGALLGGLLRLWGPIAATLGSGVLFWALHGAEWIHYGHALIGTAQPAHAADR